MRTETLDVREDLKKGVAPFGKIMAATADLGVGDSLLLLAPFEPIPLFGVLGKQGFTHVAQQTESGDWEVRFTRTEAAVEVAPQVPPTKTAPCDCAEPTEIVEVDARGLQPPQPLVLILETVATLPEHAELRARTDRRPMHLYPELESRGFSSRTEEEKDGSFITYIRHA